MEKITFIFSIELITLHSSRSTKLKTRFSQIEKNALALKNKKA